MTEKWLIVGLGNPGAKYVRTWHNCGFMAVDVFAQKEHISFSKTKHQALFGEWRKGDKHIFIVQPQTFMNNSGICVQEMIKYYDVPIQNTIIIFDDIDIATGHVRIRKSGGTGTHNGMRSIFQYLKSQDFPRIRIGIGPKPESWDIVDYVLSDIPKEKQADVFKSLEKTHDILLSILNEGIDIAMNRHNIHNSSAIMLNQKEQES